MAKLRVIQEIVKLGAEIAPVVRTIGAQDPELPSSLAFELQQARLGQPPNLRLQAGRLICGRSWFSCSIRNTAQL